ncbi:type II toxin-antitoxin system VapC family toxin [Neorhizobium galegae]|uniref:PIN domain-containing protein n=1 Tax=Neorhizobium galegae TaxID=399 RepID=UPI0021040AE1|nr:PIN domain-containing protein [Neorhizobium galegae]MCQ1768063.1 type II toxin-antitoxin system VapC family toxin [Neorhizobium galegae]MCQ1848571.1 type II toxin-antitoxin system VapC family toxin [Neorhizobium galegae]
MATAFVLDTCVISESFWPRPRENVMRFLQTASNYYIPAGALMELQAGITEVCATNPLKAVALSKWYYELLRSGVPIIETGKEVSEIWGILSVDPRLKAYSGRDGRSKSRGGQDLHIAAAALAHRLPIATMNVGDFMRIDACHPLPGIYDPAQDVWHTRMEPLAVRYPATSRELERE